MSRIRTRSTVRHEGELARGGPLLEHSGPAFPFQRDSRWVKKNTATESILHIKKFTGSVLELNKKGVLILKVKIEFKIKF